MMGCEKLLDLDKALRKVKNNDSLPFGGLDILVVGDFSQLPAVHQSPIMDTMVNSTLLYTEPTEEAIQTVSLFQKFLKFDLNLLYRSKNCQHLRKLLAQYRDYNKTGPSFKLKDIEHIGFLNKSVLEKESSFKKANLLVTTKRERDSLTLHIGKRYAKDHGVPIY